MVPLFIIIIIISIIIDNIIITTTITRSIRGQQLKVVQRSFCFKAGST